MTLDQARQRAERNFQKEEPRHTCAGLFFVRLVLTCRIPLPRYRIDQRHKG